MPPLPDVLVVGAGAVGAATARAVAARGAHVTLLEHPAVEGEAWRASAGMLAAQVEVAPDHPLFELALAGRAFLRRNARALADATGIDVHLTDTGILDVAHDADSAERAKQSVAMQRQQSHRVDWLSGDEVRDGWPWLAPCLGALWSPDDGAIDPGQLVAAWRSDASRCGARLVRDVAIGLDIDAGRLCGVVGRDRRYAAGAVVIAAGAWSAQLAHVPRPVSVEPVRGQMLAFPWPVGVNPAVVYGDHCYLLCRGDEMLVGATVEYVGFQLTGDADALRALQQRAARTFAPLHDATPLRHWAGFRPGTPDGLPIIGPEPRLPGLWYATGHGRNGILLCGVTGDLIAREIAGDAIGVDLRAFRPERFWS